jgi:hypothetical protein
MREIVVLKLLVPDAGVFPREIVNFFNFLHTLQSKTQKTAQQMKNFVYLCEPDFFYFLFLDLDNQVV